MNSKEIVKKSRAPIKFNKNKEQKHSFPIVAIGASAGGLQAFEKFFSHPPKIGMAYVAITHLDRDHDSMLPDLIKKYTSLPVESIKEGIKVKPNTIYIIPVRKNTHIKNDVLHLVEQDEPHYSNLPINTFFSSLAEDKGENAIAIILSGSGADGSLGLRDIKNHGGITIAQDPSTAAFDSMPKNAINSGLIDYIMRPEEIPLQLTKYMSSGKINEGKISQELQQIFTLLRTHTGHDFSLYKLNTVIRRIEKQMYAHQIRTLNEYVRFLQINEHVKTNPEYQNIIIVAVTAYAMLGDKDKILAAGCDAYITKPLDIDAFAKVIADLISHT